MGVVSGVWVWPDRVQVHWMAILGVAYAVGGVGQRVVSVGWTSGVA